MWAKIDVTTTLDANVVENRAEIRENGRGELIIEGEVCVTGGLRSTSRPYAGRVTKISVHRQGCGCLVRLEAEVGPGENARRNGGPVELGIVFPLPRSFLQGEGEDPESRRGGVLEHFERVEAYTLAGDAELCTCARSVVHVRMDREFLDALRAGAALGDGRVWTARSGGLQWRE